MGFKGSVESFSLADVFQNLSMNQQTGTLRVIASSSDEKHVHFENGQIRYLSRGLKKILVQPEVFFARGLVLKVQLEAALEKQKQSNESIGAVLIASGNITPEQHHEVVKHQIEEEIFDLFSWEKANFEFNEGAPADGMFADQLGNKSPGLPISHLIMEAARRVDEWERLRKTIPQFKEIYIMELQVRKQIEKGEMEVDPVERRVANLIDGGRDVDDLVEESCLFKFEVLTALGGFIQSSLIRPANLQELQFVEQECSRSGLTLRRIKVLERLLAMGGDNPKYRKDLAELLARENMIEKACIHFSVLADAEMQAKREDVAIDLYRRILSISPKHIKSHEQLASAYARRGQKREAFVHYQELFETLRDQNHTAEARVAGARALECDPSHTDLRTCLIDLLLADNQKDAAAQQIEVLGDQAAKLGNVKLAADSYRRAMQYVPNNKQLKKKLADVMLTKEDRRARKQKALIALSIVVILALACGGMAAKEYFNNAAITRAKQSADQRIIAAVQDEEAKKFADAIEKYRQAQDDYTPASRMFSPILKVNARARREIDDLADRIRVATGKGEDERDREEKKSRGDLELAQNALKAFNLLEAKDAFNAVIKNVFSQAENVELAKQGIVEVQKVMDRVEEARKRLARPPAQAFGSLEEEKSFKQALQKEFARNPKLLNTNELTLPLHIKPDTDEVIVYLNDGLMGSIAQGAGKDPNTFRYPINGTHTFMFKKEGYKTIKVSTSELQKQTTYFLKMEREPALVIDISTELGGDTLSGNATLNGDSIYVGTTNGGLLDISISKKKIVRKFDLPGGGGLNKEVYGQIFVHRRGDKPEFIVYCTKAGDCVGLNTEGPQLVEAWPMIKGTLTTVLSAAPYTGKLPLLSKNPIMIMPGDKTIRFVDCETGQAGKPVNTRENITSSPTVLEQSSIIAVGCEDGNLYGVSPSGEIVREWTTNARNAHVKGRPFIFEDQLLAGCDDGRIYMFDAKKEHSFGTALEFEGTIVMEPLALKKRLYVGATTKEGFWCFEMGGRKTLWSKDLRDMGGVSLSPVALDTLVFFITDKGILYALDWDKGQTQWTYQLDSGRPPVSAPLIQGKRVYAISRSGKIVGFDEQPK